MYYGGSRSPASFSDGRSYNGYGKGLPYNFSSDLSLSSLASRNPSIQRVINSDYGRPERSRSPARDYGSSMSRLTAFRPLSGVLSGDTSPTIRRRDATSSQTLTDSRSSPVTFLNDELSYASKPRNYYDFPSTSTGLFTYSATPIKKPKRIDYSDYLRPVLTDRPVLKSGYLPRSQAERDNVSTPIVRERKLIKFREMSDDVLDKIRRKISWDLPEEISSPLIDEMKQRNAENINENCVPEQLRSRENSLSRRGSKDISSFTSGSSPLSGSPRPSVSRRSSGESLDGLPGRPLLRKQSSRSNSLIGSSIDNIFDTFDSKSDEMHSLSKVPIPPPRKKSIGSTHKVKKPRKSSIDILLSEEKTLNYSKVADDIRRSREVSESLKKMTNEATEENQLSENGESEIAAGENTMSNLLDSKEQSDITELKTIEEQSETISDRGRRRRRRDSIPEASTSEEKPPELRRRCRSRFRPEESSEVSNSSVEPNQKAVENFEDEAPHPVSRMHRKSVKYKSEGLTPRRSSKSSDTIPDSPTLRTQKTSSSSTVETKEKTFTPEEKESNKKAGLNKTVGKEFPQTLFNQKLSPEGKVKPGSDQKRMITNDGIAKSKFDKKESSSIICLDKKATKSDMTEITGIKSVLETTTPYAKDFTEKVLKTEKEAIEKKSTEKPSKIDKTLDIKKLTAKGEIDTKISLEKLPKSDSKIVKNSADKSFKIDKKETDTKMSLEMPSKIDPKLSDVKKYSDKTLKIEKEETDVNISLDKTSKTDTKIQEVKNSITNKISKTSENKSDAKYLNKKSEYVTKNLDVKDSTNDKCSEIKIKEKDAKQTLVADISKVIPKSDFKSYKDGPSKMKLDEKDSSALEQKALKPEYKKSGVVDLGDNRLNTEKKEAGVKFPGQKTVKEELKKFDKSMMNEKVDKSDPTNIAPIAPAFKSSEIKSQIEPITSVSKSKLPENKEVEEIVVVCKLPQPKKNDLSCTKKSIPSQPNVVVSIKNSALKSDMAETNVETTKGISSKVNKIIPAKQSMNSKFDSCDSLKNQETCSNKEPEINVTHTIVLKPKTQQTMSELEASYSHEKGEKDTVRLKPIPDVIKNTVNSGAKSDSDISDIIKSTLIKADDQTKMKMCLPDIKSDVLTKNDKSSLSSCKTHIADEKLASNSQSPLQEKSKNSGVRQLGSENRLNALKPAAQTEDLSKVKKYSSAVFDNSKEETVNQHLSKVKKSSSTGFDNEKDQSNDNSNMKPDLIQMTTKTAEESKDGNLPNNAKEAISNNRFIDEKENVKIQNHKPMYEKSANDESKTSQLKNKSNEANKLESTSNSSEMLEVGLKGTTLEAVICKDKTPAITKIEPSVAKRLEGKDTDNAKMKTTPTEVKCSVDNNKNKIGASESLLKTESRDFVNNKQHNVSENRKSIDQNLEENKISLPKLERKTSIKKDDDLKSKLINKTSLACLEKEIKRNAAPAYKKSMTLPDVNALLQESNSKERPVSVTNEQNVKKIETASLSAGNVPVTLQGENKFLQNKDPAKQEFKLKNEAIGDLKTKTISNEIPSDSNISNEPKLVRKFQLPKIGISDMKSDKVEIKTPKEKYSSSHMDEQNAVHKEASRTNQTDCMNKNEKLTSDTNLKLEIKTADVSIDFPSPLSTSSPQETTGKSKNLNSTGMKEKDSLIQKSKEISDNKCCTLENIMPKLCDVIPLEKEKDKQKFTSDNLKLPAVHDATKLNKNISHQETNESSQTQNENLGTSRITRVGSLMRKDTAPAHASEVNENSKKNILEKSKDSDQTANKDASEVTIKSREEGKSNKDSGKEIEISSNDHKTNLNSEISSPENRILDDKKVTNDSQPPKPRKIKQPKLPPVPRPYNRYGLFVRPKEPPKTILESSSSGEESETESESSEEEPTPVGNKCSNLANGRSPDRNEKTRTRSETSKASIYSTLSNSTTCTTFSNSSLDDEYSSPLKSQEKTKILKFRKYEIEDFTFLKLLGKGSFGKVLLAELKNSEMYFAIKCLKKDVVLEDDDVESTMIERRVLALGTQHPYMCKLYCTFQTKSYLYFIMEYLNGGDLMFHIQETGRFEERRAMFYGAEIVSALKFLHKRGIVYRDIKLDNVMLDEQGHVRIVDFGMCQCRIYKEDCMPSNFCGTPAYIAPEIVLGQKYNQSVDWWSFGVLLYEMLIGRSPFQGTDEDELFWSICNEEPHYPRFLSKEAVHILGLLLVKSPSKRLGMSSCPAGDIKDHAFFSTINWDKIEKKQVPPLFKPSVSGPCDTSNFDSSFTLDSATLSPVDSEVLKSMDQEQFHGFSYTNPHLTG